MTQINFPVATEDGQTFDAPNGVVYTYVGTPPSGYWSGTFQNEGFTTLDGRYLKLDSSNDPLTGGLIVSAGNVGIGTDSPVNNLQVTGSTATDSGLVLHTTSGDADHGPLVSFNRGDIPSKVGNIGNIRGARQSSGGYLAFSTRTADGTTMSERARITNEGRLGIGTTNPATTLDVNGSVYFSSKLRSIDGGTAANPSIQPGNDADTGIFHPSDSNTIGFSTTGEERVRIDSNGNVLVGTTSVSGLGNTNTPAFGLAGAQGNRLGIYGNGARWWYLHGESSNTLTIGARISGNSADKTCMTINSSGNTGIGVNTTSCKLEVNGDIGIGRQQGGYTFREVVGGAERAGMHSSSINDLQFKTAGAIERMRITENGAVRLASPGNSPSLGSNTVGIQTAGGVLVAQANASGHVFGRNNNGAVIFFQKGGTNVGNISVNGTNTAYNEGGSDIRLKKNVETWTENVLDYFKTLQPKQFNFNTEEDGTVKHKGYMAQDLVDVFPEAYPMAEVCISPKQEGEDGEIIPCEMADRYMFNPSGMVKYLMKALQEATLRIEALEQQVSANQ